MKQSTRQEIHSYARGMTLHAMNAPYRVAYFFTLDEEGNLYSGEWAGRGEVCDYDRWDGFAECHPHYPKIHMLKKGQAVRVCKGGYDEIKKENLCT